jgi:uncharacterized membrane protein YfhO
VLPRAFVIPQAQLQADGSLGAESIGVAEPAYVALYTANRIVVEADAAGPSWLVLGEVWYPGWQALRNGEDTDVAQIEGALRGVRLNPGANRVEFRYSPPSAWAGLAVSAVTTLALIVLAVRWLWRQK